MNEVSISEFITDDRTYYYIDLSKLRTMPPAKYVEKAYYLIPITSVKPWTLGIEYGQSDVVERRMKVVWDSSGSMTFFENFTIVQSEPLGNWGYIHVPRYPFSIDVESSSWWRLGGSNNVEIDYSKTTWRFLVLPFTEKLLRIHKSYYTPGTTAYITTMPPYGGYGFRLLVFRLENNDPGNGHALQFPIYRSPSLTSPNDINIRVSGGSGTVYVMSEGNWGTDWRGGWLGLYLQIDVNASSSIWVRVAYPTSL